MTDEFGELYVDIAVPINKSETAEKKTIDDLYAGLTTDTNSVIVASLRHQVQELQEKIHRLEAESSDRHKEIEELRQENAILCTNISRLYETAKLEIQRKDKEIKELRSNV